MEEKIFKFFFFFAVLIFCAIVIAFFMLIIKIVLIFVPEIVIMGVKMAPANTLPGS